MTKLPSVWLMIRVGIVTMGHYLGMLLAIFTTQFLLAAATWLSLLLLWSPLATLPMWDAAVGGDLHALIAVMRSEHMQLVPIIAIVTLTSLLWWLMSCGLAGGVLAVCLHKPEGRLVTSQRFAQGGIRTFLSFVVLDAMAGIVLLLPLMIMGLALTWIGMATQAALNLPELLLPFLALLPGVLLWVIVRTGTDYARIALAASPETTGTDTLRLLMRGIGFVFVQPRTWLHASVMRLVPWLVALIVALVVMPHALLGPAGALALFVLRQLVVLFRLASTIAKMAGQVHLTLTK